MKPLRSVAVWLAVALAVVLLPSSAWAVEAPTPEPSPSASSDPSVTPTPEPSVTSTPDPSVSPQPSPEPSASSPESPSTVQLDSDQFAVIVLGLGFSIVGTTVSAVLMVGRRDG